MTRNTPAALSNAEQPDRQEGKTPRRWKVNPLALKSLFILVVFIFGLGGGYLWGRESMKGEQASTGSHTDNSSVSLIDQINPQDGYTLPVKFGDIGPQMIASGAIDRDKFVQLYEQSGRPLSTEQMEILTRGSDANIVINRSNAHFLLNFFWAFGLVNQNAILTEGPMMANGPDRVGGFASTGGWTLGALPPTALFASTRIITLSAGQQQLLLEVASSVYRPCCDNPTHFPDCNHGMAMLGLLELMASQGASADEMFEAAKYVNAFWYPQQMLEVATFFKATQNVDFASSDSRQVVSGLVSSGSGFQTVHQWLAANNLLEQAPSSGGSCGVQ